jgi:hypothetical protein
MCLEIVVFFEGDQIIYGKQQQQQQQQIEELDNEISVGDRFFVSACLCVCVCGLVVCVCVCGLDKSFECCYHRINTNTSSPQMCLDAS